MEVRNYIKIKKIWFRQTKFRAQLLWVMANKCRQLAWARMPWQMRRNTLRFSMRQSLMADTVFSTVQLCTQMKNWWAKLCSGLSLRAMCAARISSSWAKSGWVTSWTQIKHCVFLFKSYRLTMLTCIWFTGRLAFSRKTQLIVFPSTFSTHSWRRCMIKAWRAHLEFQTSTCRW